MLVSNRRRGPQLTPIVLLALIVCFYVGLGFPVPSGCPVQTDPNYGLVEVTSASSKYAVATFLCENYVENAPDNYFTGVRMLNYQLQHADETRLNRTDVTFLVMVTKAVTTAKRMQLEREGAKVVEVKDVPLPWWIHSGVKKWKDQFTKLRLYEFEDYDRIVFIDSDTLVTRPIDTMFDSLMLQTPAKTHLNNTAQIRNDEHKLPAQYVFGARSDNALAGERDHPYPPTPTSVFSAGFWVAAPSREMFNYLMSVMKRWRRFDPFTMEQSLLNYAFRREGPMPWTELDPEWSATWPNGRDVEARVATLHEKLWVVGPDDLRARWQGVRMEMEAFYEGKG
ncbi:hypothetical protein LZ554_008092 [Drepanopeziza brunnea f. sp. 'monogermtubi']|nr:hypothetical protein LZ554_008092 [Drepanopeziza brunnea f. sp. 'monogermtubi']